jgi:phage-related protein
MPHSKKIVADIFELRVRGQQEVRIFYCFYKNQIHLLSGFVKKSQKTPAKEIQKAVNKFRDLST